ncbi:hypothetical protein GTO27_03410 [Candidatus Bathyarchaeota archaeon]|nr:hypothetical protein [Candidatus Bathyarchaeota archaeon]
MIGSGDCYEVAGRIIISADWKVPIFLCHGTVTGQGKVEGVKFGHAWLELKGIVIDFSNKKREIMPKEKYYKIGKIENVKRYNKIEALRMFSKYKHFGGWEDEKDKKKKV